MKFVCDSCRAQYMISDEKVGPAGVKVRCKRCGNIILVRRETEGGEPAATEAAPPAAAAQEPPARQGLEDEIGAALDSAFAPRAPTPEASVESAPEATPAVASEPGRYDWYVAIDEKQVGPLGFEELKSRFEASSIGPDTLAWRVGLADWRPLSQIAELATHLAPRAARPATRAETPAPTARSAREKAAAEAPAADGGGWKPTAASALASLVEQEMQAAKKPEPEKLKAPPDPETTNVRNLLGALPEPPPPEPSRLIPVSERSAARAMPDKSRTRTGFWGSPSRGGLGRVAVLSAAIAVVVLVGGAAALWALGVVRLPGGGPAHPAATQHPVAQAADPQPAAPVVAEPAAPAAPVVPAGPAAVAAAVPAAAALPPAAPPAPAAAAPAAAKPAETKPAEAVAAAEIKKTERATSDDDSRSRHGRHGKHERETKVASAHERAPSGGGESAVDAAFEKELSGGGGGSTYIPPAPGASQRPSKIGQGDIMSVVVSQKGAIKTCVQKYKDSGGGQGTLVMSWVIQPSGKTGSIHPRGPDHASLASCLTKLIQTWKFPDYAGPPMSPTEFPFKF